MKLRPAALLFDMDGTLTDPRQVITHDIIEALGSMPNSMKMHLVTGSDMEKVEQQIPTDLLLKIFDRVYACNGTRVYKCNIDTDDENLPYEPELIHKVNLLDHYSEADINHISNVLLRTAANTHTKIKTGTFVEWRESQKIVDHLREEFKGWGLSFRLGGQISIDITREGWDKSYAFENMIETPDQCVFFGDKICTDGNDLDIAMKCAYYHNVESPADLILQLQEYK